MRNSLNSIYWTERYLQHDTGWDAGSITLPIKQYLDQLKDKSVKILVPGAGNGHEAAYAFHNGFENVHILDFSPVPLDNFIKEYPNFPKEQIHLEDFFLHHLKYDLVLEQTFFCSLNPSMRKNYVKKMKDILFPKGKLVGLLFDTYFNKQGPPFGGTKDEYHSLFKSDFTIGIMDPCFNSIPPRQGRELFIKLINNP
ncbi:class I SAM-dependent methyltransferase [Anditalea andensis]|uniref:SAM-dependent methlyltransferase n=1 Tax=Anditalea andensis TaxID=1048983 RepID=A0A074KUR5_9BACT|nr:SAM-dependent methyltransferase [Anditalea andensis]KEO72614.1 SAM-dependent methlyltransferase [Anditalea andensis]